MEERQKEESRGVSNLAETLTVQDHNTKVGQILQRYEPGSGVYPWEIKNADIKKDALAIAKIYVEHWKGFLPASDLIMLNDIEVALYDWEKAVVLAEWGEWDWMRLVLVKRATFSLENAVGSNNSPEELRKWTGMLSLAERLPGGVTGDPFRPQPAAG